MSELRSPETLRSNAVIGVGSIARIRYDDGYETTVQIIGRNGEGNTGEAERTLRETDPFWHGIVWKGRRR